MLLSDQTIAELAIDEELIVPFHTEQLQPCSYDVTLAPTIRYLSPDPIDHQDHGGPAIYADTKDFVGLRWATHYMFHAYALSPGEFILASTNEKVKIPDDIAARFEGKSSLGRMGLTTHITAGFIDAGFEGEITLEMKNETEYPIYISPDMKIGQLCFFALDRAARRPYGSEGLGSHYQGQSGPTTAC